ncbi:MAG: glycerate kinase [Candidatus Enterosoma sp.]|nr:glycerate kinase [Bacilli bacterium]MDD7181001.1 glycerate kinase [Bacilli bacterium]MDY3047960.1 glycerate kinase [Candidatus Enterosoma sp.]
MRKAILISDSFKGTLTTFDIIELFKKAYDEVFPESELLTFPVSDGGEGFVDSISTILKGKKVETNTTDSNGFPITAAYFIDEENQAYIECASCLSLPKTRYKNPGITSSYGVGFLIEDAIKRGVKHIYLSLGGTSTNDCGTGLLSVLGMRFSYEEEGDDWSIPIGESLGFVKRIDTRKLDSFTKGIKFTLLSDVKNPLLGENGCTYVFARQKGARESDLEKLESGMKSFHDLTVESGYPDYSSTEGAGAAGGIGCGMMTFLSAEMKSGINAYLEMIHFEEYLKDVDMIFTGEGHIDSQTKEGKVIDGICSLARKHHIPVIALVGGASKDSEAMMKEGLSSVIPINRELISKREIGKKAKENYYLTALNVLRLIKASEEMKK